MSTDTLPSAADSSATDLSASDERWFIAQRWQAYDGEARANLLRIVAVGAFYIVHLWSYAAAQGWLSRLGILQLAESGEINPRFHMAVTLLCVAWAMLALGILLALQQRVFPRWLPYFSTGCDILILTCIICLASGPRSPLVAGYFLSIVVATLRMSLPLVRWATVGCAVGYLWVLGCVKWFPEVSTSSADVHVPRYHQVIVLLAIGLAGVMLGQIVRRVRLLVEHEIQAAGDGSSHMEESS